MKKIKVRHIFIFLIVWNLIFGSILYFAYMGRVERLFKSAKETVLDSKVLENSIGPVKKAKFNNFMQWISKKDGKECIKMKITTESNKKYDLCTIIEIEDDEVYVKGYIIDDKKTIYEEVNEDNINCKSELDGSMESLAWLS